MDENDVMFEKNMVTLYPMFFCVSCALFALKLLPEPKMCDDKWLEVRKRMLEGRAHLLGSYVWRALRGKRTLQNRSYSRSWSMLKKQIEELKKRIIEEAKTNERVDSILAARDQIWSDERKKLRQQIRAFMNDLRAVEMTKQSSIARKSTPSL